ncbi:transcription factor Ouib [Drosophila willistoni]|uniref:transcription factor Ouib n=1 Tax=Drosophila willistoni TaxID=7260 RepID=UPI000C26D330|nr:transcription factor Ouib [Drosophila willistoni]
MKMEQYCRTCGTTLISEKSLNIFSPNSRQLLQFVRTITNCWVENVACFPSHICLNCQELLKKLQSFRRRCAKIEKYLSKHKLNLKHDKTKAEAPTSDDPLGIDELKQESSIKEEPSAHLNAVLENQQLAVDLVLKEPEDLLNAPVDLEIDITTEQYLDDEYIDYVDDEEYLSPNDESVKEIIEEIVEHEPATSRPKSKAKTTSNKQTMRLGRKLIHVKVIDDKEQPKRIMDRDGQTAKPCICEHCGRQFRDSSNLNVHLLRHSGTKPYECEQCHEKCYTLHLLRRHQLKHTEGPYPCTFCGLEYSTNSSRVRHEREACKKGRAPQSKWKIIKNGERTFHCEVCDLWFLRAGNYTQHINSSSHLVNERRKQRKSFKNSDK